jgi:hypothetical protein
VDGSGSCSCSGSGSYVGSLCCRAGGVAWASSAARGAARRLGERPTRSELAKRPSSLSDRARRATHSARGRQRRGAASRRRASPRGERGALCPPLLDQLQATASSSRYGSARRRLAGRQCASRAPAAWVAREARRRTNRDRRSAAACWGSTSGAAARAAASRIGRAESCKVRCPRARREAALGQLARARAAAPSSARGCGKAEPECWLPLSSEQRAVSTGRWRAARRARCARWAARRAAGSPARTLVRSAGRRQVRTASLAARRAAARAPARASRGRLQLARRERGLKAAGRPACRLACLLSGAGQWQTISQFVGASCPRWTLRPSTPRASRSACCPRR